MKKVIALIALVVIINNYIIANPYASQLNLKLHDNTSFLAVLDHVNYNTSGSNLTINNVMAGQHKLKIVKLVPNYYKPWITNKIVIFNGFISVPPAMQVFSLIDLYKTYTVINQQPLMQVNNNWNSSWNYNTNDNNCNENSYNNYNNTNTYSNYNLISDNSFMGLKTLIANNAFDSSKFTIAQQALAGNYLSSNQVAQIMELFDFESTRLNFAKLAYNKTIDKQNFYIVNGAFDFNSSITELANYLASI